MRLPSRPPVALAALALGACSTSDDPMSPDPPNPGGPPVIEDFSVADADGVVDHGDFTTLRWRAPGAAEMAIVPFVGQGLSPEGGAVSIRPHEPTTYVIVVRNSHGTATDSVRVDVRYRPGVYVDAFNGDDTASGADIKNTLKTLAEALSRTSTDEQIFLTAGTYPTSLTIDAARISVYGGLDPVTFFPGEPAEQYVTTIRPIGGLPLSVRDAASTVEISGVRFDARDTESIAAEVVDARVRLVACTLDSRSSGLLSPDGAVALRVISTGPGAGVEARGCRIFGPRQAGASETRGVSVEQAPAAGPADLLLANCFVDGGRGLDRASGVYLDTSGTVHIGMSTIGAETTNPGLDQDTPAAIRIERGAPWIGGNILFTRGGGGQRWGIQETTALGNPTTLEGNLFISVGGTPYDNFNGFDPTSESEMIDPQYTIDPNKTVGDNLLVNDLSVGQIVENVSGQNFHLKPVAPGTPNPAVDRGSTWVAKPEYGAVTDDIDGDRRPSLGALWDLGADEDD